MSKKEKKTLKFNKYPISKEFGIYKMYTIPFNEHFFENADMSKKDIPICC